MTDSESDLHQLHHTEALRALSELLQAMQSGQSADNDDVIRQKSERVKSLLASYVEQFGRMSGGLQQTQAGALDQLLQKYERVRSAEDGAAALLQALLKD